MKKLSLLLPILLAACLATVWLVAKLKAIAPPKSPATSRDKDPLFTAHPHDPPRQPETTPAVTGADSEESAELNQVGALLQDLSDFARLIERDGLQLKDLRSRDSQPDAMMWKLRVFAHEHPETLKRIERFVRSDEPLAARIFALFSFVAPQSAETIELVASIMRDPPSSALANASGLCCDAFAANGIGGAWDSLLRTYVGLLGLAKNYQVGEGHAPYVPEDYQAHLSLYKSHSWNLDLTPIVSAIITMLSNADDGVWRNKWLNMAGRMMNHPKATPKDRERLREIVEKWYLEYDPGSGWDATINGYRVGNGWHAAMEALTRSGSPRELQVIAAGLGRLRPDLKATVLDEVVHRAKSGLFEPPFSIHLEDVMAFLARTPEGGGFPKGTLTHVCVALVVYAPNEEWTRGFLTGRPTAIRQRVADGIAGWAMGGDYKEDYGRRFFAAAEHLIKDDDFNVRLSAATTFHGLTRKRNKVLSADDLGRACDYVDSWVSKESARNPTAAESELLKRFTDHLQR